MEREGINYHPSSASSISHTYTHTSISPPTIMYSHEWDLPPILESKADAFMSKGKRATLALLSGIQKMGLHHQSSSNTVEQEESGVRMKGDSEVTYIALKEQKGLKNRKTWEEDVLIDKHQLHDGARMFMSWDKAYPSMVSSVLKYDAPHTRKKRKTFLSIIDLPKRKQRPINVEWITQRSGTSYAKMVNVEWYQKSVAGKDDDEEDDDEWDFGYSPMELDDVNIRQGKHRVVESFPSMIVAIIPYTKTKKLKQELNDVFWDQHPELQANNITLSKIRNLKKELLSHAKAAGLEMSTVALGYVYFEKLVTKGVVFKSNRKLIAVTCLVLATKFNEEEAEDRLHPLLQDAEKLHGIQKAQVVQSEFSVWAHLKFRLFVPEAHYLSHFKLILKSCEINPMVFSDL